MTTIAALAVLLAITAWVVVRRISEAPNDIAQFVLTIPDDQWRQP